MLETLIIDAFIIEETIRRENSTDHRLPLRQPAPVPYQRPYGEPRSERGQPGPEHTDSWQDEGAGRWDDDGDHGVIILDM